MSPSGTFLITIFLTCSSAGWWPRAESGHRLRLDPVSHRWAAKGALLRLRGAGGGYLRKSGVGLNGCHPPKVTEIVVVQVSWKGNTSRHQDCRQSAQRWQRGKHLGLVAGILPMFPQISHATGCLNIPACYSSVLTSWMHSSRMQSGANFTVRTALGDSRLHAILFLDFACHAMQPLGHDWNEPRCNHYWSTSSRCP